MAVEAGVDGIVVSNHGARQLDYSPATISVLEEVSISFYMFANLRFNYRLFNVIIYKPHLEDYENY